MYEQFLTQIGLSNDQAKIYQGLIKSGPAPARKILLDSGLKRGLTYKVIDQLIEQGLISKQEEVGKIAVFSPVHPEKLKKMLEDRQESLKAVSASFNEVLGKMSSDFNLFSGKPNVQFFEGLTGIESALEDSLYAKTEVYSYADIESIEKYISDINKRYVAKREKYNIKKKGIVLDTPFNRKYLSDYHRDVTDSKLIKLDTAPFQTVMQMYDNKISYITLSDKEMIGVIIEDKNIATMHRNLFEHTWNTTPLFLEKKLIQNQPEKTPSTFNDDDTSQTPQN